MVKHFSNCNLQSTASSDMVDEVRDKSAIEDEVSVNTLDDYTFDVFDPFSHLEDINNYDFDAIMNTYAACFI
ncbi:hypothetical protein L2E82_27399 [Cichorium intybus]|uniref:Uncharacterized protein n=1 Tax=Cichorium intybus TaxID=13427 RepID=A0ACB9CT85_CICIN|nr:hypothetical protein L2E82_27399 [Cichorium intybus]